MTADKSASGTRPPRKGTAVFKIISGFSVAGLGLLTLLMSGYSGPGDSLFFALMIGVGVRLMIVGAMGLGVIFPAIPSYLLLGALAALFTLAGPSMSGTYLRHTEETDWANINWMSGNGFSEYEREVPLPFRRPEYIPNLMLVKAHRAAKDHKAADLWSLLKEINDTHKNDPAYGPAREAAAGGLTALLDDAVRKMSHAKGTDPQLQAAFKNVLKDLSSHESDDTIYVMFTNRSDLTPPPGSERNLAAVRRQPSVTSGFPKGDIPVAGPGEAFSATFDEKRCNTFMHWTQDAFAGAFNADLLQFKALPGKTDPRGKYVLQVDSFVRRTPGYYVHSTEDRTKDLLFGLDVLWNLRLLGPDGKPLYSSQHHSFPAEDVKFKVKESDPDWAPYSVMMDSAYYNYTRQIILGFGLKPPPEKVTYTY